MIIKKKIINDDNSEIETYHLISARRPDILIINLKTKEPAELKTLLIRLIKD